ncbi:glycosyltransferase [Agrococcus sp. SGAir0287]|uniref:glycosyltransferase n=1 Tax=Agrococcus sp. SGAir0287 TaxID=2070347 RepID=UPI001585DD55|nr:glycosyltransferase [Agrococcus sp. SGAir0287]
MRIAMVSMHTSPADRPGSGDAGGMNVYVLETARALAAHGHRVDLFTRAHGTRWTKRVAPGVTLFALETGGGVVRKQDLPNLADDFGEELQRVAVDADEPYDVIHAHYWLSGLAALPVSLALGVPLVQTFHTLAVQKAAGGQAEPERRRLTERYLALEADAVVAVSNAEADCVIDELHVDASRIWLVRPGVDADAFAPPGFGVRDDVRARLGVRDHEALVVVAGRIQSTKGQDLAVRMLEHLDDAVLAIAGEPPPGDEAFVDELVQTAASLGVEDRVRRIGSLDRPELARLLGAASLVLIPSRAESFGIVALEAAACGTPVVAAHVGGLPESVVHGTTGILVEGRDPERWAAACRRLIDDPVALSELSTSARAEIERRTWQASAARLDQVYRALGADPD